MLFLSFLLAHSSRIFLHSSQICSIFVSCFLTLFFCFVCWCSLSLLVFSLLFSIVSLLSFFTFFFFLLFFWNIPALLSVFSIFWVCFSLCVFWVSLVVFAYIFTLHFNVVCLLHFLTCFFDFCFFFFSFSFHVWFLCFLYMLKF